MMDTMSTTQSSPHDYLEIGTQLLAETAEITLRYFQHPELAVETKGDGTPVTVADREAEHHLRERITALFPGDGILGEEHGEEEGTTGRRWVIDPIDGTKAFSRGVGLYSTLLYLEDETGPLMGAISIPALGEVVAAERGRGCWWNGARCSVSEVSSLSDAVLTTSGFDYWKIETLTAVHSSQVALRTWGDGYGYVLVATGRAEAMVDPIINYWDIAPCRVIIPEAGGRFTTLAGVDDPHPADAMATNRALHDEFVQLVGDGALFPSS